MLLLQTLTIRNKGKHPTLTELTRQGRKQTEIYDDNICKAPGRVRQTVPGDHSSARAQEGNKFLTRTPLYGTEGSQSASVVRGQAVRRVGRGFVGLRLGVRIRKNTKIETKVESGSHKVSECKARPYLASQTYHTARYVVI